MRLSHVGNLEALNLVLTIPVDIPEVQHVLNILHRIDMAIDVHIIIIGVDSAHQFRTVTHLHAPALVDGALLVFLNPVVDSSVVDGEDIRRLTGLRVDHRPNRAAIAIHPTLVIDHTEVTTREVAHRTLHPSLHVKLRVHLRHLLHLDGQS